MKSALHDHNYAEEEKDPADQCAELQQKLEKRTKQREVQRARAHRASNKSADLASQLQQLHQDKLISTETLVTLEKYGGEFCKCSLCQITASCTIHQALHLHFSLQLNCSAPVVYSKMSVQGLLESVMLFNQYSSVFFNLAGLDLDLVKSLVSQKGKTTAYSEQHKEFALNCHFYSPACYDFLRKTFTLPSPSTLRSWVSTVNCLPGK